MTEPTADPAQRPAYIAGQWLRRSELVDEHQHRAQAARTHRLAAHDHGVVSGLAVTASRDAIVLAAGVATDGLGIEIVVRSPCVTPLSVVEKLDATHVDLFLAHRDGAAELRLRRASEDRTPPAAMPRGVARELADAASVERARSRPVAWPVWLARVARASEDGPWGVVSHATPPPRRAARILDVDRVRCWHLGASTFELADSDRDDTVWSCDSRGVRGRGAVRAGSATTRGVELSTAGEATNAPFQLEAVAGDGGDELHVTLSESHDSAWTVGAQASERPWMTVTKSGVRIRGNLELRRRRG